MAHNELILEMVKLGVIPPAKAVELMEFEGKEQVLSSQQVQMSPEEIEMRQQQEQMANQLQMMPTPESAFA